MTCCFIGHRNVENKSEIYYNAIKIVEDLIINNNVDTFLFGSKSAFDDICLDVVSRLKKEKYPHLKRIYVRATFELISHDYEEYLLELYDETYYPKSVKGSARAAYIIRNREMIDKSDICVFYYLANYAESKNRASGTKQALDYALSRSKWIVFV